MLQNPHHYPWRRAPSLVRRCPAGADKRQIGVADGACCTGAGRAGTDKRQKGVAGNDGGVTGDQLHDGACAR